MIDHVGLKVKDYKKSKLFYENALAPLGYKLIMEFGGNAAGFGIGNSSDIWINQDEQLTTGVHIAFLSDDRESVREFYDAALKAGGKDNGPPGLRTHYHPNYYGAFVMDPDGNNIEAVCHKSA